MESRVEKRTFIPPEYRPYVKGSRLCPTGIKTDYSDPVARRKTIINFGLGKEEIVGLDAKWADEVLKGFFPLLRRLRS